MPILFALTTALSAFLLFWLQFLTGRLLLPIFGGSPLLWLTSLCFFQSLLCGSYFYAHVLRRYCSLKGQSILHISGLLLASCCLPIGLAEPSWTEGSANPFFQVFLHLLVACSGPFFILGATSSLVQHWYCQLKDQSDPYWLYGASNLGSVLALLLEPTVLEPGLSLSRQSELSTLVFLLCAALLGLTSLLACFKSPSATIRATLEPLDKGALGRCFLLSLTSTMLLYGLTGQLTTDLASVPLLWIVPLSLYLLSFVIAFSFSLPGGLEHRLRKGRSILIYGLLILGLPNLPIPRDGLMILLLVQTLGIGLLFYLLHRDIALNKSHPSRLTEFYLALTFGGLVGGVLCSLAAPSLFPSLLEYPLGLLLAALVIQASREGLNKDRLGYLAYGIVLALLLFGWKQSVFNANVSFLVIGALCFWLSHHFFPNLLMARLLSHFVLLLGVGAFAPGPMAGIQRLERSFFGVHRVVKESRSNSFALLHGHTVHGRQSADPNLRREPLLYYYRGGPAGQVFDAFAEARDVAVCGLGLGSLAPYGTANQRWTFFEIDPVVLQLARDTRYFHYLEDAQAETTIVLGDARRSLLKARKDSQSFDLIVLDTFSSGAVPVHLLTIEAFELYLSKLAPQGLLLLHISNKHLDLEPLIAVTGHQLGLSVLSQIDRVSKAEAAMGLGSSHWVVLARSADDLLPLAASGPWKKARENPGLRPWTDDHSDLISILKTGR
jgi:hypothetical protein